MIRFLILLAGGVAFLAVGLRSFNLAQRYSANPVDADLFRLEKRDRPPDLYVAFGDHVKLFDMVVVSFAAPETGMIGKKPPKHAQIYHCYIPVISKRYRRILKKAEKKASVTGEAVHVDRLAVLIKSRQFKTYGEITHKRESGKVLQGVLTGTVADLPATERENILSSFGGKVADRIWILDEDAQPPSRNWSMLLIAVGGTACLLALILTLGHRRKREGPAGQAST